MADNKSREEKQLQKGINDVAEITVSLGVDVSDALTGLKAIQREARKTVRDLKELEFVAKEMGVSTSESVRVVKPNE